jgi:hypothetical protein
MKLSSHIIRRVGRAAVFSLALAAIAVPASQASRSAQSGGTDVRVFRLHGQAPRVPLVTDNAGRPVGANTAEVRVFRLHGQAQSVPLVTDHSAIRGYATTPLNVTTHSTSGGFAWRDAGIGAAGAFALVALGAGTLVAIRKRFLLLQMRL